MYSFKNDYSEGVHPEILSKIIETNTSQQSGYGEDEYSLQAKEILKQKLNSQQAAIYFASGGTQSNLLIIAALLRVHEAVISAKTGHIYANETGAIEALGHKIIPIDTNNGKLHAEDIKNTLQEYTLRPHVVKPKLVYISNATEIGTIYSKSELQELSAYCKAQNLYLFLDGARLGHALTATGNDLTLADIYHLTDVFYIGATKNGALFGEAIVFNNSQLAVDFDYVLKQKGALLAKGRFLGIQFLQLFRNDLYYTLAKHANTMASKIAESISKKGFNFLTAPVTNQIFPILPKKVIEQLLLKYDFFVWRDIDEEHSAIRLITSWATDENYVNELIIDFNDITRIN